MELAKNFEVPSTGLVSVRLIFGLPKSVIISKQCRKLIQNKEDDVLSLSQTPYGKLEPTVQVRLDVQLMSKNYHSLFKCLSDKV